MKDPFGNLSDWGRVLDILDNVSDNAKLEECQTGLIRILKFKGNWRLREEVLKRVGSIQSPCDALVFQVLSILADDNIYYEARILATEALIQMLKNAQEGFNRNITTSIQKVIDRLRRTLQPNIFDNSLKKLYASFDLQST